MSKKKSPLRKWIILALFLIIAAVIIVVGSRGGQSGAEVAMASAERGDITSLVSATGQIHPEIQVVISSEVPGEIVELPVSDGQAVERGDLLARVNPDTLEAQVKQQEASLASVRASSASQRASMLQAELDLGRIRDLAERGFVTPADLDQARTGLEAAKASYESSVHQIERQEMQLKEARDQLGKASLFAPMSGTIISINAELGDRVVGTGQFAGTTIMRIADLGNMELRVAVSEIDIVTVAINNQAEIEVDALPGETFMGTVYEIANSALTSGSGSQEQQTTFEVRIRFDTPDPRLRPGMTATADIRTRTVTDVIKVPLGSVVVRPRREVQAAISGDTEDDAATTAANDAEETPPERGRRGRDDRARVVFVVEDGKAMLRQVETGISDRDHIEILSGLDGSERLITGPYRAITRELKHGDAVVERSREGNGGKR